MAWAQDPRGRGALLLGHRQSQLCGATADPEQRAEGVASVCFFERTSGLEEVFSDMPCLFRANMSARWITDKTKLTCSQTTRGTAQVVRAHYLTAVVADGIDALSSGRFSHTDALCGCATHRLCYNATCLPRAMPREPSLPMCWREGTSRRHLPSFH